MWKEKLKQPEKRLVLGNERLLDTAFPLIAGKRLGLITNPSGVDSCLRATADQLHQVQGVDVARLDLGGFGRGLFDASGGERVVYR